MCLQESAKTRELIRQMAFIRQEWLEREGEPNVLLIEIRALEHKARQ